MAKQTQWSVLSNLKYIVAHVQKLQHLKVKLKRTHNDVIS